jgi:hypothetical protein
MLVPLTIKYDEVATGLLGLRLPYKFVLRIRVGWRDGKGTSSLVPSKTEREWRFSA